MKVQTENTQFNNTVYLPAMHGTEGTDYDAEVYEAMAADYAYIFGVEQAERDLASGKIDRIFYNKVMDISESHLEGLEADILKQSLIKIQAFTVLNGKVFLVG